MIRLFNVYYPIRTVALLLCEALLVCGSFLLATSHFFGAGTYDVLIYKNGILKIVRIAVLALLLFHYFDMYEPQRILGRWEIYFRLLLVMSILALILAGLGYLLPEVNIGPNVFVFGTSVLAVSLVILRSSYEWIIDLPGFRKRVYVLGRGERARHVIEAIRARREAGMEVVEGSAEGDFDGDLERFAADLRAFRMPMKNIDRVIIAMEERRALIPVHELLQLRIHGVVIEDCNATMERLWGKLPLESLYPSSIFSANGFNVKSSQQIIQRLISITISFIGLMICLPFIPFIILGVRLSSPGPIFLQQTRVGLRGRHFSVIKFRTMRQDAESQGAVWATANDPRVTPLGRFMRRTRLDEIPQLWNVLRGEMSFVGPRPERPEFVQWLSKEIPFYELRQVIRPGITGWAQVRYQYGASLEETKKKLEYDLYYVKHLSVSLDLLIMFETIKTIVLQRGAQ